MATKPKVKFAGTKVQAVGARLDDMRPALKLVGLYMVKVTVAGFRAQRRGPYAWMPRRVPNVAGAIRDLAHAPKPKTRRFAATPALVDTGALRQSITFRPPSRTTVVFGSMLEYARRMQSGGESSIPVTATVRKNLSKWLKKNKDQRENFGWVFAAKGGKITITANARPFCIFTGDDKKQLSKLVIQYTSKGKA